MGPLSVSTPVSLVPIGAIHTPYPTPQECPGAPHTRGDRSRIVLLPEYSGAVDGLRAGLLIHVLWWAEVPDRSVLRRPHTSGGPELGVFSGRGVLRPNPLGLTLARIASVAGDHLVVTGMDCATGTTLIDIKPVVPDPDVFPL